MQKTSRRFSFLCLLTELAGAALLFYLAYKTSYIGVDYPTHIGFAKTLDLSRYGEYLAEHSEPLWHTCTALVRDLLRVDTARAAGLVSGGFYALLYLVSCALMKRQVPGLSHAGSAFFCLVLHLVSAVYVPFFNKTPYLGQGSPNIWHSPTIIACKPFALLAFGLTVLELKKIYRSGYRKNASFPVLLAISLLLVLATLAKPGFTQIYYPGIFLLMFLWLFSSRLKNLKHCLQFFLMCLPSLALLVWQYIRAFFSGSSAGGSGVVFRPSFAAYYSPSLWISGLLLLLFPALMLVIALIRRDFDMTAGFSLLLLLSGFLEKHLLEEAGNRKYHGNFSWGWLTGAYLAWYAAMRVYLALLADIRGPETGRGRVLDIVLFVPATIALLVHLASGLYYLYYLLILGNAI